MIKISKRIRELFETGSFDLPGFHSFPTNSCEGAALFLGKALKDRFPDDEVHYVTGEDESGAKHFWVEVNDSVYDITADQFTEFQNPVYNGNNDAYN
jgi:hypothetical protein